MPTVLAFDVNETLLDLSALDPLFERTFGDAALRPLWFAQMLQLSFVGTITGRYVDFTSAQRGALSMLSDRTGRRLDPSGADEIIDAMTRLAPHPEVEEALARLSSSGIAMSALTNSPLEVANAQLANAGLRAFFDRILSADEVQRLKPAPEPYRMVAERFGVDIADVRLVAAHAWDVSGALAAGCQAAFVARPGMTRTPIGPQPDLIGADIADVAGKILARETQA
jgi:2-haloacid dehalogenase